MDKSVYKATSVELMLIGNNHSGQLEGFDLRANLFPRSPSPVSPQNLFQTPMNSEYVSVVEASQKAELWPTHIFIYTNKKGFSLAVLFLR